MIDFLMKQKKVSRFCDQKSAYPAHDVGASPASPRRRAPMHHQTALLKRILGTERATGAYNVENHHTNRSGRPGRGRTAIGSVDYR